MSNIQGRSLVIHLSLWITDVAWLHQLPHCCGLAIYIPHTIDIAKLAADMYIDDNAHIILEKYIRLW